jgi:hypothetical protein
MDWYEHAQQEHFSRPSRWPWIAAFVAITAGGIFVVTRGGPDDPDPTPAEPLALVALEEPEAAEPIPLPPARQTDALFRELLGDFAALAEVGDLVRRFVGGVNQIADGQAPRAQLEPLTPKDRFRVREREGEQVIDEQSYRRYDVAADLLGSLDATRVAAAFRQLEPVFDHTHEELGARDRTFRETLALAIDHLAQTPIPDGTIRLRRHRRLYAYADPSLEALSDAQKQLLRMGPRNSRIVQSSLRELVAALDLPPVRQHARLPEPP